MISEPFYTNVTLHSRMEEHELITFLKEKQFEGVVTLLCENVTDLQNVENVLNSDPTFKNEFKLYNPDDPHFSNGKVIWDFMDYLANCKTKAEKKGNNGYRFRNPVFCKLIG